PQLVRVGFHGADGGAHHTLVAQVAGARPGAGEGDADDSLAAQFLFEGALGPPVRDDAGGFADDVSGHPDPVGFGVVVVDPRVADVRCGHHHDLAVVGGVGEDLLVSGHSGVEHDFT